ncbi:hypothetical protein HUJ04_001192 [Dendroctonus ponderosae]|uniref:Protein krueppel n=1 Tax=Dendroctonus ponderosae TaxID=77166 RepID=A0AAR5PRK2_DENPD|nr:hypothetical protein HUJ04_001192 [Dendroctonus ponderosae]
MEVNPLSGSLKGQCFACLSALDVQQPLVDATTVLELFKSTFQFQIEFKPHYPKCVCHCCQEKLQEAGDFLSQVRSCIEYLEELQEAKNVQKCPVSLKEEEKPVSSELACGDEHLAGIDAVSCKESNFDSESDNEPLSKWMVKKKRKKKSLISSKLKRVPLRLVQEAIGDYRAKCQQNSNCVLCDFKGLNVRNLSCHMLFKHKEERAHWCLRCNMMVEDLESHKKTHANRIWCSFCEKGITRCHYVEHLKYHAGQANYKKFRPENLPDTLAFRPDRDKPYQCHICQKPFKLFKSLEDHVYTHGRYKCDVCEKNFEIPELLASHWCSGKVAKGYIAKQEPAAQKEELLSEAEDEDFKDDQAQLLEQELDADVKSEEPMVNLKPELQVESLTCHFCQRTYKTAYKLQKHIEAHMGIFLAKCQYCDKGFSSKADLTNHERVHTKEKPFICSTCGKGFVSGATLRIHMKQHTGKPEECELCQKRFCRKSELKLHLQKHRGERPFLCTDCGKSFAQKSHLTCHLTMHSEERPYPCNLCDKSFKKKELLKHHMNLHGDKKFKCEVCLYECHKKYRLQQHMRMHEGKTGAKVNPCPLCNRSFGSLHLLNIHMGNAHSVVV